MSNLFKVIARCITAVSLASWPFGCSEPSNELELKASKDLVFPVVEGEAEKLRTFTGEISSLIWATEAPSWLQRDDKRLKVYTVERGLVLEVNLGTSDVRLDWSISSSGNHLYAYTVESRETFWTGATAASRYFQIFSVQKKSWARDVRGTMPSTNFQLKEGAAPRLDQANSDGYVVCGNLSIPGFDAIYDISFLDGVSTTQDGSWYVTPNGYLGKLPNFIGERSEGLPDGWDLIGGGNILYGVKLENGAIQLLSLSTVEELLPSKVTTLRYRENIVQADCIGLSIILARTEEGVHLLIDMQTKEIRPIPLNNRDLPFLLHSSGEYYLQMVAEQTYGLFKIVWQRL